MSLTSMECHSRDRLWGRSGGSCGSESWALNSSGLADPQHVDPGKRARFTPDPKGQVLPTSALKRTRSPPAFISTAMWGFSGLHKTHGTKHVYIQHFLQRERCSLTSILSLFIDLKVGFLITLFYRPELKRLFCIRKYDLTSLFIITSIIEIEPPGSGCFE